MALVAETREEYDALVAAALRPNGDSEDGHPFLGYIGHGGGATVAQAGGRRSPAPSSRRPAAPPAPKRERTGAALVAPRARALLKELGLTLDDAREIAGSGPGGRILDRDVTAWAAGRESVAELARADALTVARTIPLRGRRGTIATRMVSSLQTAAQLTSVLELDVKPLVELRSRLNEAGAEPRIGVTAIVVKLVAAALREHPGLNARVTEREIELLEEINVAVAVETDEGLVAPVVAGADGLSLEEINARIAELAARARDGALTPDELDGGTFTVSNGGIHPVDITTAILNPPQVGILWIGRIRDRPVVLEDGAVGVRPTMQACLTFDHRASTAARPRPSSPRSRSTPPASRSTLVTRRRSTPRRCSACTGRCSRSGSSSSGSRASSAPARSPASCTCTSARRPSPPASARTSTTATT